MFRLSLIAICLIGWPSIITGFNSSHYPRLTQDIDHELSSAPLGRTDHKTVVKAWSLFTERAPFWINDLVLRLNSSLQEVLPKTNVSEKCSTSLNGLLTSIRSMDEWAMKCKIINSTKKFD